MWISQVRQTCWLLVSACSWRCWRWTWYWYYFPAGIRSTVLPSTRDVVQLPVFVTAALKRNKKNCFQLVMCWPVASASIYSDKTRKLCFTNDRKCRSTLLILKWIMAFCLCNPFIFLPYGAESILLWTMVVALHSSLHCIARYQLPGDHLKFSLSLFSMFPMFVQTVLWFTRWDQITQRSIFWQHSTLPVPNIFYLQQSCLKSMLNHKSILASLFPDEVFSEVDFGLVESGRVISWLRLNFRAYVDWTNTTIECTMFWGPLREDSGVSGKTMSAPRPLALPRGQCPVPE